MVMKAATPGEGVVPIQIRAQALRRSPVVAPANPVAAYALMPDDPDPDAGKPETKSKGNWRQADVKRAIHAAEQAGLTSYRVEIEPDGTIAIVVGDPADTDPNPDKR